MIQSKLSKSAYFYSILILIFPFVMIFLINKFITMTGNFEHWGITAFIIVASLITVFVVIWGFFVEMNLRMATLTITDDKIIFQKFLGYGKKTVFDTDHLQGFITKGFKTRGHYQEYCYILQSNVAVGVFSSMYYANYNEMRAEIQKRLEYLG